MSAGRDIFVDRVAAGAKLARALKQQHLRPPVIVLGLPRGGVPVAYEVARALRAPLDVLPVRKVAMPDQPELAIGAIAPGDVEVREAGAAEVFPDLDALFAPLARAQRVELARREHLYRGGRAALDLNGSTVVLVDDGLATGCTMLAAIRAARRAGAATIVVAAPVASPQAVQLVQAEADRLVILQIPAVLSCVGEWYGQFDQLDDAEVCRLLDPDRRNREGVSSGQPRRPPGS